MSSKHRLGVLLNPQQCAGPPPAKTYLSPAVTHPHVDSQLWSKPPGCLHWVTPAASSPVPCFHADCPSPGSGPFPHNSQHVVTTYTSERLFPAHRRLPADATEAVTPAAAHRLHLPWSSPSQNSELRPRLRCVSRPSLPAPSCWGDALTPPCDWTGWSAFKKVMRVKRGHRGRGLIQQD